MIIVLKCKYPIYNEKKKISPQPAALETFNGAINSSNLFSSCCFCVNGRSSTSTSTSTSTSFESSLHTLTSLGLSRFHFSSEHASRVSGRRSKERVGDENRSLALPKKCRSCAFSPKTTK